MTLLDALRHAEQQGKRIRYTAALKSCTTLRRPFAASSRVPPRPRAASQADPEQDVTSPTATKVRTGIVSVNGRDVGEMRCTGGRRSSLANFTAGRYGNGSFLPQSLPGCA